MKHPTESEVMIEANRSFPNQPHTPAVLYAALQRLRRKDMENQHRKISGYRELEQHEIDSMNEVKKMEREVLAFIDGFFSTGGADDRWLAIAYTDLQKGFMALGRAIARPDGHPVDHPRHRPEKKPALEDCEPIVEDGGKVC